MHEDQVHMVLGHASDDPEACAAGEQLRLARFP
jgi:hypothetical protein